MPKLGEPVGEYKPGGSKVSLGEPVDMTDNESDPVRHYFQGFNNALYKASGWSFLDQSASMLGLTEEGTIGEWMRQNVFRGGSDSPDTEAERIAAASGEGTAFAALSLIPQGIAAQLTTKAPLAAKTSERVVGAIEDAFRANPTSVSILETISGGTSEAARQAAEEGGAGPVGQTGAAVAGGVAPLGFFPTIKAIAKTGVKYSPTSYAWRAMRGKDQPIPFDEFQRGRATQQVSRALRSGIGDSDDVARADAAFDRLGVENRASLAERSGSPQLLAKQREIEGAAIGSELDNYVRRKVLAGQDVREAAQRLGPASQSGDQNALVNAVSNRLSNARRQFDAELQDVEKVRAGLGKYIPESDRMNIGQVLRDRRAQIRKEVSDQFTERADDIGLNNNETGIDATDYVAAVKKRFFNPKSKFANKEKPEILKVIKSIKGDDWTFDDIKALRTRLNDDIASTVNDNRAKARELIEAKEMLDDWFTRADPPPGVDADEWARFRADYLDQFINRFEKGTAYSISKKTPRGDYQTTDEKVADAFLKNESTVGDYYRLYADADGNLDAQAKSAMESAIYDKANQYAVRDGVINERRLSTFLANNKKVLDKFPEIKSRLDNRRGASEFLSRREAVLRDRRRSVERTRLRTLMDQSGNPDEMLSTAMRDPKAMRALIRSAEAAGVGRRPVQALIWERMVDTMPETGLPGPNGVLKFITDNKRALRIAFSDSPGHIKRLDDIYSALEVLNRTPVPGGAAQASGVLGQAEQYVGTGIAQGSSRVFAVQTGRTGKVYPFLDGAVRFLDRMTKRHSDALMKRALFDPRVAEDVHAAMLAKKIPKPIERRLNAYLFNMGFGMPTTELQERLKDE